MLTRIRLLGNGALRRKEDAPGDQGGGATRRAATGRRAPHSPMSTTPKIMLKILCLLRLREEVTVNAKTRRYLAGVGPFGG